MQTNDRPQCESTSEPRRGRISRWRRVAGWVGAGLIVFLLAMPYLVSIGPIRDFLFRAVTPPIHGSVHAGGARLGWFLPVRFENIEIRTEDGEAVVSILRLEGNRSLWRMLSPGKNLGDFRIERPRLHLVLEPGGSNLGRVFAGYKFDRPPNVALGIQLVDGSVQVRGIDSDRPWTVEPVNLALRLRPSTADDGRPRLEIEPGTVFPRTKITPEACGDLLKYIAPMLSGATEVGGSFSMELDRWDIPMGDFARGSGSGRLMLHELEVSPGPMVRELAEILKVPPKQVIAENEPIAFRLADGRVYHERVTFHLERLTISTSGSVGLDGSLDVVAELSMPAHLLGDRPLAAALAKQKLRIPIRGTLNKPKIDGRAVVQSLTESGLNLLDATLKNGELDLGKALQGIQQRREERLEKQKESTPGDQQEKPPARPLLRGLIRGVIDEAVKEAEKPSGETP